MGRTKQTPRGSASHRPVGMTAATFTGMGRGKASPEEQFRDAPKEDTEEDFPLVLEDAEKQPKEGKPGASKSKGKKLAQAAEGAEAPPEETPLDPKPTKPQTDPAPAEPQPGTSKAPTEDPTQAPTDETAQPATRNPDEDEPPASTKYVMAYKAAGKDWLDSVVKDGEEAYTRLFNKLLVLGPYIDNFDQADKEQVFKCIRDKTGRFLDDDDFVTYVETGEEKQKPRYVLTDDAKVALTDYYDEVHTLCEAQQNFVKSTQVLEKKIADKSIFLDIIKQVQLPAVKVEIRTVEEMERMEGKTYRELTLMCHLPNFKRINPNAKEQTRMMAAYMYCVLYEQITGIRASQTGCARDFRCQTMPFKRLITGKRQPSGPGRSSEARGGSSRSLEEVAEMEGAPPAKRTRKATKSATATKATPKGRGAKGK